jgi:mono/diheme cytochrome c family protein
VYKLLFVCLATASISYPQTRLAGAEPEQGPLSARAFLNQYCVGCHNERAKTAGLMLDKMDVGQVAAHADVWE